MPMPINIEIVLVTLMKAKKCLGDISYFEKGIRKTTDTPGKEARQLKWNNRKYRKERKEKTNKAEKVTPIRPTERKQWSREKCEDKQRWENGISQTEGNQWGRQR